METLSVGFPSELEGQEHEEPSYIVIIIYIIYNDDSICNNNNDNTTNNNTFRPSGEHKTLLFAYVQFITIQTSIYIYHKHAYIHAMSLLKVWKQKEAAPKKN